MCSHEVKQSWEEVSRHDEQVKDNQILDSMWVYVYKLNKTGHLVKCKARLVVRGDQQQKTLAEENHAATLAARSFRKVLATAARFDLKLKQFDAVNVFVNAGIDKDVFMQMPQGYRKPGTVLKLKRALYGLRQSPLLWQRALASTLENLGFRAVPQEPCIVTNKGIIIFFYVDDIVLAYRKRDRKRAEELINGLRARYELTGGDDLHWFLGLEVHRDRTKRLVWLSQTAYIEKIFRLAQDQKTEKTPMDTKEVLPYLEIATSGSVGLYQRKIGSLLYVAINTRPDVAFVTSRLARFNQNPGPEHHKAADRVLCYLYATRFLALQLRGGDILIVASDASFADKSLDRKSSQGYAIILFGGLIAWRASKQDTVTTSATEAELLALAQAAKEGMFLQRLLKELSIELVDHQLSIQCDNRQTIRLINAEVTTLQTKLRHVDIHNHWLRQERRTGGSRWNTCPPKRCWPMA